MGMRPKVPAWQKRIVLVLISLLIIAGIILLGTGVWLILNFRWDPYYIYIWVLSDGQTSVEITNPARAGWALVLFVIFQVVLNGAFWRWRDRDLW